MKFVAFRHEEIEVKVTGEIVRGSKEIAASSRGPGSPSEPDEVHNLQVFFDGYNITTMLIQADIEKYEDWILEEARNEM